MDVIDTDEKIAEKTTTCLNLIIILYSKEDHVKKKKRNKFIDSDSRATRSEV